MIGGRTKSDFGYNSQLTARNSSNHSRLSLQGGNSRIGRGTKNTTAQAKPEESKKTFDAGVDIEDFDDNNDNSCGDEDQGEYGMGPI